MPKGKGGVKGKGIKRQKLMNPLQGDGTDTLDQMTLEAFQTWSLASLKAFLMLRERSISGTFDELASRAFVAWEDQMVVVDPTEEHALRRNLADYKAKLQVGDAAEMILPDPYSLEEDWLNEEGRMNWPSLYLSDIVDLLKMTTPTELYRRVCNEYKQGKGYRYFTSGWVKEVHFHPISEASKYAFLAAKVRPSMKTGTYEAWVAVEKDTENKPGGQIISSYCTCTAGLKGSCNHIVGMLFRVEYAVKTGLTKPTCTSLPCVWNVPADTGSEPVKLCEQLWTKSHYFKQDADDHSKSVRQLATAFNPVSQSQEAQLGAEQHYQRDDKVTKDLADILRKHVPSSVFMQLYDKQRPKKKLTVTCPPSPREVAQGLQAPATVEELQSALQLEDSARLNIEVATRCQVQSSEWHNQRAGRITASRFHNVCTKVNTLQKNPDANTAPLVKSVMGYVNTPKTVAMKHGLAMEPHAKKAYQKVQCRRHKRFRTSESGLVIDRSHPFLGASPDLLVTCACATSKCQGNGLCEVKCPESIKDSKPTPENYSHLTMEDGVTRLSKKSQYYLQVQGQMAIACREYCDFFVYTAHGHFMERIVFDAAFWHTSLAKLVMFWENFVAPELLFGTLSAELQATPGQTVPAEHSYTKIQADVPAVACVQQKAVARKGPFSKPKLPRVYLCGICGETILSNPSCFKEQSVQCKTCTLWCHVTCGRVMDIDSIAAVEWWCPKCE